MVMRTNRLIFLDYYKKFAKVIFFFVVGNDKVNNPLNTASKDNQNVTPIPSVTGVTALAPPTSALQNSLTNRRLKFQSLDGKNFCSLQIQAKANTNSYEAIFKVGKNPENINNSETFK